MHSELRCLFDAGNGSAQMVPAPFLHTKLTAFDMDMWAYPLVRAHVGDTASAFGEGRALELDACYAPWGYVAPAMMRIDVSEDMHPCEVALTGYMMRFLELCGVEVQEATLESCRAQVEQLDLRAGSNSVSDDVAYAMFKGPFDTPVASPLPPLEEVAFEQTVVAGVVQVKREEGADGDEPPKKRQRRVAEATTKEFDPQDYGDVYNVETGETELNPNVLDLLSLLD